jgi:hypothetical protein
MQRDVGPGGTTARCSSKTVIYEKEGSCAYGMGAMRYKKYSNCEAGCTHLYDHFTTEGRWRH